MQPKSRSKVDLRHACINGNSHHLTGKERCSANVLDMMKISIKHAGQLVWTVHACRLDSLNQDGRGGSRFTGICKGTQCQGAGADAASNKVHFKTGDLRCLLMSTSNPAPST